MRTEEFLQAYEKPKIPCIIQGAMEKWRANRRWQTHELLKRFRKEKFKCGEVASAAVFDLLNFAEDDDGYSVKLKLKHFLAYAFVKPSAPSAGLLRTGQR